MKKLRDHTPNVMNKVVQIFLYVVITFTVNGTLYSQDDILFVSEKNEFSEVSFFGVGGVNYLMKDNPKGERFGAGFDVGIYYRTAKLLRIGLTIGLHGAHNPTLQSDYDYMVKQNKIEVQDMLRIDYSQKGYLVPIAICARFDLASKEMIPFIRVDAGINYTYVDMKGIFTIPGSIRTQSTIELRDSYSYTAPMLALSMGVDYPITSSFALSGLLKLHATHKYMIRDRVNSGSITDFGFKYTMLSFGITKKM